MSDTTRVLLISGSSTRNGSANTAALATAAELAPAGITAVLYGGLADLPAFNPDHDGDLLPPVAAGLRGERVSDPQFATAVAGVWDALLALERE